MEQVSPEVEEVLERFLPLYQEDRKRWPLWTYRRSSPDGNITADQMAALADSAGGEWQGDPGLLPEELAWRGVTESTTWSGHLTSEGELRWSWPDRLRWSPQLPISGIESELDGMVRRAGAQLPPSVGNTQVWESVEAQGGDPETIPFGFVPGARRINILKNGGVGVVDVPLRLRARTRAIFAATAPTQIPESASAVSVPAAYTRRCYLDDHDWRELLGSLGMALIRGAPPRLFHFIRRSVETGRDPTERGKGWEDPSRERFNELTGQVFEEAGLLPSLQGGTGDKLRGTLLRQLHKEALELVQEVKDYEPDGSAVSAVMDEAETEAFRRKSALQMRFPFLTLADLKLIRCSLNASTVPSRELARQRPFLEDSEIAMLYGKGTTPKRAASILLRGRLPSNLSYDGLARRLKDA